MTLELKRLVEKEIEDCERAMGESFCPFEPQKTQEIMAGLNGARDTWEKVSVALDGDWDWIMEEESEQVRDNPEGE